MGIIMEQFKRSCEGLEQEVQQTLDKIGQEVIASAIKNGNYKDRTGRLRRSNTYSVENGELILRNDAEYATQVEAKGYDVLSGSVEEIKTKYKL